MGAYNNTADNIAGDLYVIRGEQDPTATPTRGAKGTIFIRVGALGGSLYQKQDDGETVNWVIFATPVGADVLVKASGADTTPGFLGVKLANGTGISAFTILNPGANEQVEISLDTTYTDGRYFQKTEFINTSTGAPDAGKPVVLDAAGLLNSNMIPVGAGGIGLPTKERITLAGGDITNGFIDLANEATVDSVLLSISGVVQDEAAGVDYTTSVVAGPVTRITFETNLATGGASALIAGDLLNIQYLRK